LHGVVFAILCPRRRVQGAAGQAGRRLRNANSGWEPRGNLGRSIG